MASASLSDRRLVEVLLATYNGEAFLREQIESILAQDYAPLRILARDDGSKDGTRAILEEYARAQPERFSLLPASASSGSARGNFLLLMQASTAEYVCFADQDDVWIPAKISLSMDAMHRLEQSHGMRTPLLVFTDLRVVNDRLNEKYASFWRDQNIDPTAIHALRRLLTRNVVTGCTALLNRPLCSLAARMPEDAFMHDWWIALCASTFGHAEALATPTVLYRQHASNVLGAVEHEAVPVIPKLGDHTVRRRQWEMTARQAAAMLRVYQAELSGEDRRLLEAYVRCDTNPSRLVRTWTLLRNRFFLNGLRANVSILWYLWRMDAARRANP